MSDSPRFILELDAAGKWYRVVKEADGTHRPATEAENAEAERLCHNQVVQSAKRDREAFLRIAFDPDFIPEPTPRYTQYVAWKKGRAPGYRPTRADVWRLAAEEMRELYGAGASRAAPGAESKPPCGNDSAPEASSSTKAIDKVKWLAEAMLLVQEHPTWSDAAIADKVGKHPSTLSRNRPYQTAAAMARGRKQDLPAGHQMIDPDTGLRDIEAYSDRDDPAELDWDNP